VDCASVGHLVSLADPVGDTVQRVPEVRGERLVPAHAPWADLTQVRVSATSRRLCVDFRTAAQPRAGETLSVAVYESLVLANEERTSIVTPTVVLVTGSVPEVEAFQPSATSGQVGSAGDWTSLVVDAQDIGPPAASFLGRPFAFRANTIYQTNPRGRVALFVEDTTRPAAYG